MCTIDFKTNLLTSKIHPFLHHFSKDDPAINNLSPVTKSTFCSLTKQSYEYGSCLLQTETQLDTEASDFFRFAQATNSFHSCVYNSPLRFLINSNRTFCPLTLDQNSCSTSNEKINSNFFINKFIIANSNKDKLEVNKIEYFFCPTIFASQLSQPSPNSMASCAVNLDPDTKIFDPQLNCQNQWTEPTTSNLDQITGDFYLKTNPSCQLTTDVDLTLDQNECKNVLGSVKHLIFWQGNEIKKILTRIVLTNVQLGDANFKQFFETKWVYLPNAAQDPFDLNSIDTVSGYDNLISGEEYFKVMRSGHRGYVDGRPIIAGFFKDSKIDAAPDKRFSAFRSLSGKLCGQYNQQERILVSFGKNISSSCVVQVAKDDLIDEKKCGSIRSIMFQKLNDYFVPSNRVSKNGNANVDLYNETEWLEVFRSQFNESMNDGKNSDGINRCRNVPYKVNLYLFYGDVGRQNGQVINEIFGAYVKVDYRDWVFICKSNDDCSNRPQDFTVEFEANFINDFKTKVFDQI
ncbi:tectonic-2 isoform X2 [Brachionus plicatilis]|uniref:Tectonic-2 isoform X2 n=1 Tax=Brachionus plicatilis TaxID=10195 RepID=A0A3M7PSY4_BRAPC|nr:tectonic-2 isoform X2 [Brachionus plicatilis]